MILIVGGGAVGTILATYLMAARRPVTLLIRPRDSAAYAAARELRTDAIAGSPLVAAKPAVTAALDLSGIDYLFVCVKFPALDGLLAQLPAALPQGLTLVSTLNGVAGTRRIRERFPHARVAAMSVMFNGQLLAPLHAQITTRPQALIGSEDARLLSLFDGSGMQVKRARGEAAAWGKLLINLANAICALTHTTFKDLLTQPDLRAIFGAVLDEAVSAIEAAGIDYELPMPVPYRIYRKLLAHGGPIPWWFAKARNGLQEGAYPSMVADIEQGRMTEIGQLNGEIVRVGQEHGIPTPRNAAIVELVRRIEGRKPAPRLTPSELRARLKV